MTQFLNLIVNLATLSDLRNKNMFYLGEASFTVDEPRGCLICLAVFLHLFIHSTNAYIVPPTCQAQ